jgi:NAD(P)-dependent dehydrogenase (short-subunit alcohol dehydrogenase family)
MNGPINRRDAMLALSAGATLAASTTAPAESKGVGRPAVAPDTPRKHVAVNGSVALVTGSNRGVGLGFVRVLLERGAARVYATARNPRHLAELKAIDPKRVLPLELDVTNDAHRREAAATAQDATILINNAAYPGSAKDEERRFLSASTLDDTKHSMDVNCWSPAELARLFIPIILRNSTKERPGAVLNILSGGALFCVTEFASYSTSKAAAMMMTSCLRAETDRQPILVASVFTGSVKTRTTPIGSTTAFTPEEHAREVFDAIAAGQTHIYPATGPVKLHELVCKDPEGFERRTIERFHTNPLRIAPFED